MGERNGECMKRQALEPEDRGARGRIEAVRHNGLLYGCKMDADLVGAAGLREHLDIGRFVPALNNPVHGLRFAHLAVRFERRARALSPAARAYRLVDYPPLVV